MTTTPTQPTGHEEAVEVIRQAVLDARWPNGDPIDALTSRTAPMVADSVLAALRHANLLATEQEWGVRYPSGSVESYGDHEAKARRFSLNANGLRPDLPTLVVRKVVTAWTEVDA